jgi:hypothetical protein
MTSAARLTGAGGRSFEERRRAWRSRLDAAKQGVAVGSGCTAACLRQPSHQADHQKSGASSATGHRGVTFSVPILSASRRSSAAASPSPSPKPSPPKSAPLGAHTPSCSAFEAHEVPPEWRGCAGAECPIDFAALTDADLHRFLRQAGCDAAADAAGAPLAGPALVLAAREARGAWEVARVATACCTPEEVLRLSSGRGGDAAALRAAFKKVAVHVHPVSA